MVSGKGAVVYIEEMLFEDLLLQHEQASTVEDFLLDRGQIVMNLRNLIDLINSVFCTKD